MQTIFEFGSLGFWPCISLIAVGTVAFSTIPALATNWRKTRVAEAELGLKAQMIERGMSVEEIERVLSAGRSSKSGRGHE
jgi:hypothetical protein